MCPLKLIITKNIDAGVDGVTKRLSALAASAGDLDSVPTNHMTSHNPVLPVSGEPTRSSGLFWHQLYISYIYIHEGNYHTHKINISYKMKIHTKKAKSTSWRPKGSGRLI